MYLIIWIAGFFINSDTLNFLLYYVKLLLIGHGFAAWICFMSKHRKQIQDFYHLICFSVYSCSRCFCSGFQNFAGDTYSWDFQVINQFTELHPIYAWRNPTQNPVFLLSESCSPGARLWMGFAFVFLGKCTKGVRVIMLVLLYWLLWGTFCFVEKNSSCPVFLCFFFGLCLFFTVSSKWCCKLPLFLKRAFCFFIFHLGDWCEKGDRLKTKAWHACIKSWLYV